MPQIIAGFYPGSLMTERYFILHSENITHPPSPPPPPVSPSVKSPIRFIISLSANPFILIHAMTRNRWLGNVGWKIPICNPPPPVVSCEFRLKGKKCTLRAGKFRFAFAPPGREFCQRGTKFKVDWPSLYLDPTPPPHLFLDKSDTADASSAVQRFAWDVLWSGYLTSEQCWFWRKLTGGVEFFWN